MRRSTVRDVMTTSVLEGVVSVVDHFTYHFDERLADSDVAPLA